MRCDETNRKILKMMVVLCFFKRGVMAHLSGVEIFLFLCKAFTGRSKFVFFLEMWSS